LGHRCLPCECRHENGGLLQLVLAHPLRKVVVRVARAHIVGVEVLDHVEAGEPRLVEGHVVGGADSFKDIPRGAQLLQRLEPAIECRLGCSVALHVEAEGFTASRIVVQIDGELVACSRRVEVLRQIGARTEQPLLLAAPEGEPNRSPRLGSECAKNACRLHHRNRAVGVVGGAARRVPRIEVCADEHDLIAQLRIAPRNLRNHVVAVAVVFNVARPQFDAKRHGLPAGGKPGEDVVLLAGDDDRRHGIGGGHPVAEDADRAIAIRAWSQRDRGPRPREERHQLGHRRRAPRTGQRRISGGNWLVVQAGLRPILVDPFGLRKVREDDRAAKLSRHRLDL
jgi:hypothetical protein